MAQSKGKVTRKRRKAAAKKGATADWQRLIREHDIINRVKREGYVDLTSEDFKFGPNDKIEIRLVTKMDSRAQVPPALHSRGLNVLPISDKSWRIGFFDPFVDLPDTSQITPKPLSFPKQFESLDPKNITSEGQVISILALSGVLETFCGEKIEQTISGKARSGNFTFSIDGTKRHPASTISVGGFQYEVDAGFEGPKSLFLIEAKNRSLSDFNMRQLYFPMRAWESRVTKPIRTIFVNYSNKTFDLIEYEFSAHMDFSSCSVKKHERYSLGATEVQEREIARIAKSVQPARVSSVPYPQADSIERLMDLVDLLSQGPLDSREIASAYNFDVRQADYYANAGKYLGLMATVSGGSRKNLTGLSVDGVKLSAMELRDRKLFMAEKVLRVPPVNDLYQRLKSGETISIDQAYKKYGRIPQLSSLKRVTAERRLQTAVAWAKWLLSLGAN